MADNPFTLFNIWFDEAKQCDAIKEPTAMTLATATKEAAPSCRILLLKELEEDGIVFYTNYESWKSHELKANPQAAICFYWMPLDKQVRMEGRVTAVSDAQSDAYFAGRPHGSQIGAWASRQSQPLESREALIARIEGYEKQFEGKEVSRPPHWGGWKLTPHRIEFWHQQDDRLHDRWHYVKQANGEWVKELLNP